MVSWISDSVRNIGEWVGNGIASVFEWLLGGLADMFTLIFDAANSIFDVFESLWELASGFAESLISAFTVIFPFVPEPIATAIGAGLLAVVIVGVVKKVRGK